MANRINRGLILDQFLVIPFVSLVGKPWFDKPILVFDPFFFMDILFFLNQIPQSMRAHICIFMSLFYAVHTI